MQGHRVLWVPGCDHAGIATQVRPRPPSCWLLGGSCLLVPSAASGFLGAHPEQQVKPVRYLCEHLEVGVVPGASQRLSHQDQVG